MKYVVVCLSLAFLLATMLPLGTLDAQVSPLPTPEVPPPKPPGGTLVLPEAAARTEGGTTLLSPPPTPTPHLLHVPLAWRGPRPTPGLPGETRDGGGVCSIRGCGR